MSGLFLSYRRDDSAGFAGRLADALETAFGAGSVFRDVDDIRPGEDFIHAIDTHLKNVDAVLVMIGPHWLAVGTNGQRRLDADDDFVRMEIQAALASGKPLIPLLVGGVNMPAEAGLPPTLAGLARRQAVTLSDGNWRGDVERLVASLRALLPPPHEKPRARRWLVAAAVVAVLLGAYAVLRFIPETPRPPPLVAAVQPANSQRSDIGGRWTAQVKYDWGDQHAEVFEFKNLGNSLHGTASYLNGPLTIEHATLKGEWLRFSTRSQEMLGDSPWKEARHDYIGKVTPAGIEFTLETTGGYSIHPPVEFIARRSSSPARVAPSAGG